MDQALFWTLLGFLSGSIPYSLLVARAFAKVDIRQVGDGNPGGTNAWKAGGWHVGVLASLLDMIKAYLPVWLARQSGLSGWELVPVALAPILGHAFSPFLRFRGGKALAASGGAWVALVGPKALAVYLLLTLPVLALQEGHALASNAGLLSLLGYAILVDGSLSLIVFAALNLLVVAWKHRQDLFQPIQLRPWMAHVLTGRSS